MKKCILVVDDDQKINHMINVRLKKHGYSSFGVLNGESAIAWIHEHKPVLVLLDVRLPDINGVEVLRKILEISPGTFIIMISAHADIAIAVECIKLGAYDFIEKPFEFTAFDAKLRQVFKQLSLEEEVMNLKRELGASYKFKSLVGSSSAMMQVFRLIDVAAHSDVNVLIQGESGTGKELVARSIHNYGNQKDGSFVAVNCAAIPEHLLESELFGYEKGAFTGAAARKIGKFEHAHGGTIFLDEIGDLSPTLQVKLLRVLQEREIERVGGNQAVPIKVRFMTATHRDLKKMVEEKKFREDLYYRINVFPITVPALRQRKEDIPELFLYFVNTHRKEKTPLRTDEQALQRLSEYDWPGNVRELENFVERLLLLVGESKLITLKEVNGIDGFNSPLVPKNSKLLVEEEIVKPNNRVDAIEKAEKAVLEKALEQSNGNITEASKRVEMSRDSFYRKMKKYAIQR